MRRVITALLLLLSVVPPAFSERFIFIATFAQSNMSGPGTNPSPWPTYANASRIYTFGYPTKSGNDTWSLATDPLGDTTAGMGPLMPFANEMINQLDAAPVDGWVSGVDTIGIVLRSYGGSDLPDWSPIWLQTSLGVRYYGGAVKSAQLAKAGGKIKGAITYLGETFARGAYCGGAIGVMTCTTPTPTPTEYVLTYLAHTRAFIQNFRHDIGIPTLPVIVTELGPDPSTYGDNTYPYWGIVQACARTMGDIAPYRVGLVSAADLTGNFAGLSAHLTPASQLILGPRYAVKMHALMQQ